MAEPIESLHSAWNCRWSHLGYRLARVPEHEQPDSLWVCVRPPNPRRSVTEDECAKCEFWEANGAPKV